jgi:uncharacterized lipoprotein YmbA
MRNLFFLIAAAVLAACSTEQPEPAQSNERPSSVIGDPLHDALDRAQSVQGTLDEHAAEVRRQLEAAEGN